jgi:hypothetical protein
MNPRTGVVFQARCENCEWKGPVHKSPHQKDNSHKYDKNRKKAIKDGGRHKDKKGQSHIITIFVNEQPLYIF